VCVLGGFSGARPVGRPCRFGCGAEFFIAELFFGGEDREFDEGAVQLPQRTVSVPRARLKKVGLPHGALYTYLCASPCGNSSPLTRLFASLVS